MDAKTAFRLGFRRILLLFLVALSLVWAISEVAYFFMKDSSDRAPETIELVIPEGTAASVAAGEPVPAIPEELVFVVGDTLLVRNQDSVDHQLGPVWVPAGASASLVMKEPERLSYTCSFQTSKYLDLDVKAPTTIETRLIALSFAVPTLTMFFFVYSLVLWPLAPRVKSKEAESSRMVGNQAAK